MTVRLLFSNLARPGRCASVVKRIGTCSGRYIHLPAGYSYQWSSRLANPKVGWLIGWISFIFLIVVVVAVDYAVASTVIPSLLNYAETPQNAWLVTAIVVLVQIPDASSRGEANVPGTTEAG